MPPNRPACTPAAPSRRSRGIVSQIEKGGDQFFLPPKVESWPSVGRSSIINSALCVSNFIYLFILGGRGVCNQQKWICQTYQTPFMCIKIREPPPFSPSLWHSRRTHTGLNCLFDAACIFMCAWFVVLPAPHSGIRDTDFLRYITQKS